MTDAQPAAWHRWLALDGAPGWLNMARDLALLERTAAAGECWLRLYTWSPACLSFGRHEPAARTIDHHRLRAARLDAVRRPSGGGLVLHAAELTYAVAAPLTRFGGPRAAYARIHETLGHALEDLGLATSPAPRPARAPAPGQGSCFASAAGGELLAGGAKVVGSAQLRRGTALLQHGSLPLDDEGDALSLLLREHVDTTTTRGSLSQSLGRELSADELAEAIAAAAGRDWPGFWSNASDELLREVHDAVCLHGPRFRSSAWTWGR